MENLFYTLQDFYTHTKGVTYVLMVGILVSIAFFWKFLAGNDDD